MEVNRVTRGVRLTDMLMFVMAGRHSRFISRFQTVTYQLTNDPAMGEKTCGKKGFCFFVRALGRIRFCALILYFVEK